MEHRDYPIRRLMPNMVTMCGLCCGLTSIRYAFAERWELAVILLIVAAVLDGMDGRIARMLKSTSEFGAQLDSLSDFLCFGVAPAILMYLWSTHDIKAIGWAASLFFAVCTALRLARFNTGLLGGPKAPWRDKFFTGVPSPAGAMLCVTPIVLSFEFGIDFDALTDPRVIIAYIVVVGAMMASHIPTFAVKKVRIPHHLVLPLMLLFGLYLTGWLVEPWTMFWVTSVGYLLSIPVSIARYRMHAQADR